MKTSNHISQYRINFSFQVLNRVLWFIIPYMKDISSTFGKLHQLIDQSVILSFKLKGRVHQN